MRKLLGEAAERSLRYLESLDSRPVAPRPEAVAALKAFDIPLPERGAGDEATLRLLDEVGTPATMAMAGPRFFGFVIGGSLPVTLAANWLAGAWDQNTGLYRVTPGTAHIEQVALRWLLELLRLPRECGGAFVTGATVANLCALAAARHAVLARAGWDVEARGLFGAPEVTVIVSEENHPSVMKSLGVLGLGRNRVLKAKVDRQGRILPDQLPELHGPTILCTQAGNVNTGACDPVAEICRRAKPAGAWVHVDGAFGLWAAAAPARAALVAGIEAADSWATDAHKWLNVPYDSGLAFVRDAHALQAAMAITAEYLPTQSEGRNPSDFTPELSRRARGVEIWSALHALGRAGVAEMIERNCALARHFADRLAAAGFEILNDVVLNQVLVAFGDARQTARVIDAVQADGTCWAGITVWQGRTAMRISVSCWSTTDADVDRSVEAMVRIARASAPAAARG
ncbi:MAG TPA: aminotransferase class V-fold PLP-dependent enzyme [Burkholderiales bacterium]|nr:aminotransferase class V-fold PLP-dependent enzyme [Burkholderiales bacterium]